MLEAIPQPATASAFRLPTSAPAAVLVVEDEPELAEILACNLRKHGYAVSVAYDGLSACRQVIERRPDLILLDVQLPDLDGWEICRMIRAHQEEEIAGTPIVMVTALGTLDDRLKGLELGADDYIPKPYSIREILLKAQDLVRGRKKELRLKAEVQEIRTSFARDAEIQGMLFHEMRNQLAILGGFSSFLLRRHQQLPAAQTLVYAETIRRSCQFLSTLAEELLIMRNLRTGEYELPCAPLDAGQAVTETLALYAPIMADAGFTLQAPPVIAAPPTDGNEAALRLIVSILLENALKYGGSQATLTVKTEPAHVVLCLQDEGDGIPADEAERIFDKFYRGRNVPAHTRGSGLGLFFARTLAEAIKGELVLLSGRGAGSCFAVRLPRAERSS